MVGAGPDRLEEALGHDAGGAVRRDQRQDHIDAAVPAPHAARRQRRDDRVDAAQDAEHAVEQRLEAGLALGFGALDGLLDVAGIGGEIVHRAEAHIDVADAEEVVVGVGAVGAETRVGGGEARAVDVALRAAVHGVRDEREVERALADAEPVGDAAQAVAVDGDGGKAPGLFAPADERTPDEIDHRHAEGEDRADDALAERRRACSCRT